MPGFAVILLFAAFVAGLALLIAGLRGRRLNDHPVCAWCAFDLDGVYPESVTCPECGAGLKRDGSIRIGVRRRMPGVVLMGVLLAAVPLAPLGAVAWALVTGTNVDSYKPLGLLLWETGHSDSQRMNALAVEIQNRLMARKLDPAQYQRVIEATLELQGDLSRPWTESWGDLIERAKLDGVLKPEQEQRFNSQAAVLELKARPTVQAGGLTPVRLTLKEARVGTHTSMTCSVKVKSVAVQGKPAKWDLVTRGADPFFGESLFKDGNAATFNLHGSKAMGGGLAFFGGAEPTGELLVKIPEDAATGPSAIDLSLDRSLGDGMMGFRTVTLVNGRLRTSSSGNGTSVSGAASAPIRVVRPEDPIVTPIPENTQTTAALAQSLRPQQLTIGSGLLQGMIIGPGGEQSLGSAGDASVRFKVNGAAQPLAFDVFCRAGGREWKLGELHSGSETQPDNGGLRQTFRSMTSITINGRTVTSSSSSDGDGREVSGPWQGENEDQVDIVLRPSAEVAAKTIDLDSYYNGEIVFHDVPVARDPIDASAPFQTIDRLFRQQLSPSAPNRQRPSRRPAAQPSSPSPTGKEPL